MGHQEQESPLSRQMVLSCSVSGRLRTSRRGPTVVGDRLCSRLPQGDTGGCGCPLAGTGLGWPALSLRQDPSGLCRPRCWSFSFHLYLLGPCLNGFREAGYL